MINNLKRWIYSKELNETNTVNASLVKRNASLNHENIALRKCVAAMFHELREQNERLAFLELETKWQDAQLN